MSPSLERARLNIASEIGSDVAEFTPADQKNLLVETAVAALGGAFLTAFFTGIAAETGKKVGEALVDFIADKIEKLRSKNAKEQDKALEESADEAVVTQLKGDRLQVVADNVEISLSRALTRDGADEDVSIRVARRVRHEAIQELVLRTSP